MTEHTQFSAILPPRVRSKQDMTEQTQPEHHIPDPPKQQQKQKRSFPRVPVMYVEELVESFSQKEVAEMLGVSQSSVSEWMRVKECPPMAELAAQHLLEGSEDITVCLRCTKRNFGAVEVLLKALGIKYGIL